MDVEEEIEAWAASGAMGLTGRADGPPLGPPSGLVDKLRGLSNSISRRSRELGESVDLDPLPLLAERAALLGLSRHGQRSCGGATRLLPTADGWLAVSLARPDDVELVPAWLGVDTTDDPWAAVAEAVSRRPTTPTVQAAAALGMPIAALGEVSEADAPTRNQRLGEAPPTSSLAGLTVVDLSSLWAGPLCGSILADAGATVIKVESTSRPDGARSGPASFFDLMNAGKRSVALPFEEPAGRAALARLLEAADVVIEASRPRALEQLGFDAHDLGRQGPRVWVSITAHGRDGSGRNRAGFGDDAAVAGGLVAWERDEPLFCADAVADPTTGLAAADAVLERLASGGRWLLDVSMARVAAQLSGPTLPAGGVEVRAPTATRCRGAAAALGADTDDVLTWIGRR